MMTKIRPLSRRRIANRHAINSVASVVAIVGSTLIFSVPGMAAGQQIALSHQTVVAENNATTAPQTSSGSAKPTPLHLAHGCA
jgi:hypothetical protein